jgi:hypothetical protein
MATPIASLSVRWRRSSLAETDASDLVSAACYCRSKHIGIEAVVVPELKFRDVERHIFRRHFVERADHAAFEDRPKTLNRVRMNRADHVLLLAVVNNAMREVAQVIAIAGPRVGRQQANLVGNRLIHEIKYCLGCYPAKDASNHVTLPLNRANDRDFVRSQAALAAAFVPMLVAILAAYPRLVHFHDAAKLGFGRDQPRADFVAHEVSGIVAAEAHHALNLQGAHSLLAGKHQMGDAIPVAERLLGVLKNRPCEAREPIAVFGAFPALPVKRLVARGVVQVRIAAARAMDAFRPTPRHQVAKAGSIVPNREASLELSRGHLRDWFRALCHGGNPSFSTVEGYCHVRASLSTPA